MVNTTFHIIKKFLCYKTIDLEGKEESPDPIENNRRNYIRYNREQRRMLSENLQQSGG